MPWRKAPRGDTDVSAAGLQELLVPLLQKLTIGTGCVSPWNQQTRPVESLQAVDQHRNRNAASLTCMSSSIGRPFSNGPGTRQAAPCFSNDNTAHATRAVMVPGNAMAATCPDVRCHAFGPICTHARTASASRSTA